MRGQTLFEIVIALAIFSMIASILVSVSLGGFTALTQGGDQMKAAALAEEGIEALRSIRDGAWNELRPAQGSQTAVVTGAVGVSGNQWIFTAGAPAETVGKFTRTVTLEAVCRDPQTRVITVCPAGAPDPHTERATVSVSWETRPGVANTVTRSSYLAGWDSKTWRQTDWSGGVGQAVWSDTTKFTSYGGDIYYGTSGEVSVAQASGGSGRWSPSGQQVFTDTTDTHFSSGSITDIAINGSGVDADLTLAQDNLWATHPDSGSITQAFNDIDSVASNDIWAVGDSGKFFHYDGTSWQEKQDIGSTNIRAVDMISATEGWAAGGGRIYKYASGSWTEFQSFGAVTWNAMHMLSPNFGFIVGTGGKVVKYNGATWSFITFPTTGEIRDVYIYSETLAIAGGVQGNIYIWDDASTGGLKWRLRSDTGSQTWSAVTIVSPTEAWVAGSGGQIYHIDRTPTNGFLATSLASVPGVSQTLEDIRMLSATDGWIVGASGTILRLSGGSWVLFIDIGSVSLNATSFIGSDDGWAVGNSGTIQRFAFLYKSTGTFVSRVIDGGDSSTVWSFAYWNQLLPTGSNVTLSVRTGASLNTSDGSWSSYSIQYSNSVSTAISPPAKQFIQYKLTVTRGANPWETPQIHDISVVRDSPVNQSIQGIYVNTSSDAWAVTDGGNILRYNGTTWSLFSNIGSIDLEDIVMLSPSNGWIVGQYGNFFRFNGSTWSSADDVGSATFNALSFANSSFGFAVGNNGVIARYDGSTWDEIISPAAVTLNDIAMVSASDGWTVGSSGLVLRYQGGDNWGFFIDTGTETWHAISMISGGADGWMVGSGGAIRRWNGTSWIAYSSPTTATLYNIQMISPTNGWVVGSSGTILHWDGANWTLVPAPVPTNLFALHLLNGNMGWAGGGSGNFAYFQAVGGGGGGNGSLISSAFPLVGNSPVESIEWDEAIPTACVGTCKVRFQIQVAPDSGGSPGAWFPSQWMGPEGDDGDEDDYFTLATGHLMPNIVNGRQWVRYKVELTGDGTNTPVLQEVRIQYK